MNDERQRARWGSARLICGVTAFLGTPIAALILRAIESEQVENGIVVSAVVSVLCVGFAGWPRPGATEDFGARLGELYFGILIGGTIIGVVVAILIGWR